MRIKLVVPIVILGGVVIWLSWSSESRRPLPRAEAAARGAPAPPLARRSVVSAVEELRRLIHSTVAGGGLCGTEVSPPPADVAPGHIPPELWALGQQAPDPTALRDALQWAVPEQVREPALGWVAAAAEGRALGEQRLSYARPLSDEADEHLLGRYQIERELGHLSEALATAQEAQRRWTDDPKSTLMTASALLALHRNHEAVQLVEQQLGRLDHDRDPDYDSDSKYRRYLTAMHGFACSATGDLSCVERALQALDRQGSEWLASFARGYALSRRGEYVEAMEHYRRSQELYPDFDSENNLAMSEIRLGQNAAARARWLAAGQARSLSPRQATSLLSGMSYSYFLEDDGVSAWVLGSATLAATGATEASSSARKLMAMAALALGDLEEARAQVAHARAAAPHDDLMQWCRFAHPTERAVAQALVAEQRGDEQAAIARWLEAARSDHPSLSLAARRALVGLCP